MLTDDLEWIVVALDGVSAWHWVALQLVRVSLGTGLSRSTRTGPAATATESAGSAHGTTAGVSGLRSIDDHSEPAKTQSQNEGEYP